MAHCTTCDGRGKIRSKSPSKDKAWEVPCPTCRGNDLRQHDLLNQKVDDAEQALSQMYYLVIGKSPQWSKTFSYPQALDEVKDALALLRAAAR